MEAAPFLLSVIIAILFAVPFLFATRSVSTKGDIRADKLKAQGRPVVATLVKTTFLRGDVSETGMNRHDEYWGYYTYEVDGKTYSYKGSWGGMEHSGPPPKTLTLYYFPDRPDKTVSLGRAKRSFGMKYLVRAFTPIVVWGIAYFAIKTIL